MSIEQPVSSQSLTVLVVEDNEANRRVLESILKRLGFAVRVAGDGAQAVESFIAERPDLILMDVIMPIMDGFEATRRIKALCGDHWVPVVFLSALDEEANLVAGLDAGGDDYLTKPINFVVLKAKLRSLTRTLAMQRSLVEMQRRTQAVSDNIIDGVITINASGTILSVNPATTTIFGYERQELIGKNVNTLMPEPYHSAHDSYLRDYLSGGKAKIIGVGQRSVIGKKKNGAEFPLEIGVTELHLEHDRVFVGIVRDVSARVSAERTLQENARLLQRYHDAQEQENTLAQDIVLRLMHRRGLADSRLHDWLSPAARFSGDIIAASGSSDGRLYVLLADATGHGLAAAISVLPVLMVFYGMAERGMELSAIVTEFNRHLRTTLPSGRFVAATLLCLDEKTYCAQIWSGGMPDVLLLAQDGSILRRFVSPHLPLGIVDFDDPSMIETARTEWQEGCQFVLYSDGLLEASNTRAEPFGLSGLAAALAGAPQHARLSSVQQALTAHLEGAPPHDDISLMLVDCRSSP